MDLSVNRVLICSYTLGSSVYITKSRFINDASIFVQAVQPDDWCIRKFWWYSPFINNYIELALQLRVSPIFLPFMTRLESYHTIFIKGETWADILQNENGGQSRRRSRPSLFVTGILRHVPCLHRSWPGIRQRSGSSGRSHPHTLAT